jgi:hypothetical protein
MILGSRASNTFQGPLLAKRIEQGMANGNTSGFIADFRLLLISASAATLFGIFFTPTFQRLFTKAVDKFRDYRSVPLLIMKGFTADGLVQVRNSLALPSKRNIIFSKNCKGIPIRYIVYNTVATAIWTTGVFSSLYAGYLNPDVRVTSRELSAVINGLATIIMFVLIDPYLSVLTDDVIHCRRDHAGFRQSIVWLAGSRFAGTLLSQLMLIPAAMLIVFVAEKI